MFASTGETITSGNDRSGSTPGAGIFRSIDGGDTWHLVPALEGDQFDDFYWVQSIAFDTEDPTVFYAGKNGIQSNSNSGEGEIWKFDNHGAAKTLFTNTGDLSDITHIVVNP